MDTESSRYNALTGLFFLLALCCANNVTLIGAQNVVVPSSEHSAFRPDVINVNSTDNSTNSTDCPAVSDKDVFDLVLKNYSRLARPHLDGNTPMIVIAALRLFGIQDFMERESTMYLNAYLDLSWVDEYLVWDSVWPLQCLKSIVLPAEVLWLPDVVLLNSPDNPNFVAMSQGLKVIIAKDGTVLYSSLGRLETICELDLTYFPFDRQICPIHFESWTYPSSQEHITFGESNISLVEQLWTENKQWRLIGNYTYFGETIYPDNPFDKVVFFLILERKALFYYVNVIIPSMVIAIVEIVTFFLPLTEVVKVHISFTCLLAYSVFQTMVIGDLPRSSSSVPLLCLYIDLQMAYIGLAIMCDGIVFLFFENSVKKKECPYSLYVAAKFVGQILLVHNPPKPKPPKGPRQKMKLSQTYFQLVPRVDEPLIPLNLNVVTDSSSAKKKYAPNTKERQHIWLYVAEVTERISFLTYILAIVITPSVLFGVVPKYQPDISLRLEEFLT